METSDSLLALLAALIDDHGAGEGSHPCAIEGVYLTRLSSAQAPPIGFDEPVLCVVAQGSKRIMLNQVPHRYDPQHYFLASLALPMVGQVVDASGAQPFLGVSIELDVKAIGELMLQEGLPLPDAVDEAPATVAPMRDELLGAIVRLLRLAGKPRELTLLGPLIKREIYSYLLLSEHSGMLRRMASDNSQARRIHAGIDWLKRNMREPIRMADLAREVAMSQSTMHQWFKLLTTMSPLQFQKQLRLQEARRILLFEGADAGIASARVGYASASQFSREYRRHFGLPPSRDVERIRAAC